MLAFRHPEDRGGRAPPVPPASRASRRPSSRSRRTSATRSWRRPARCARSTTWSSTRRPSRRTAASKPKRVRSSGAAARCDVLVGLLTDLGAGTGHVALVEGEPGVGKSRLARELARLGALTRNGDACDELLRDRVGDAVSARDRYRDAGARARTDRGAAQAAARFARGDRGARAGCGPARDGAACSQPTFPRHARRASSARSLSCSRCSRPRGNCS